MWGTSSVSDPVGAGFVESLARPGGNVTGFALYEFGMSAKWLEMLKRIAPNVTRVGVLRDAALTAGVAYLAAIQSVAPSLGIEVSSIGVRESEIERAVTAFAGSSNRGLIMTPTPYTAPVRNLIIALAARHKLPTVYYQRFLVAAGGLASYDLISSTSIGGQLGTLAVFSRARRPLTCRCSWRPNTRQ